MRLAGRIASALRAPVSLRTPGGKALAGTAIVVAVLGGTAAWFLVENAAPVYQPRSQPVTAPSGVPSDAGRTASPRVGPPVIPPGRTAGNLPVEITIPSIGVNAQITQVYDNGAGGSLVPPPLTGAGADEVGWWAGIPGNPQKSYSPGQAGPAVLVGHINSSAIGDLVFSHLRECSPTVPQPCMRLGDTATVTLANGTRVRFVMLQHMQEINKLEWDSGDALAGQTTAAVYGPSSVPVLRLITCGGTFDSSTGHYRDNIIAYLTEE